ncbi:hypothetical protein EA462_00260 [Natrarchaeobius halalkaliphilus]|uniref:Uncharacterized protein n=1 Tax=Natrarchaeobius halalkaliphilus TaxID=1679091 RepID=A0A3N6LXZ9_9EURY|nr:hypothetical protein [Natrarchaeobius halalkaliphilus]RQG92704.1 hypothetical protein EA462_00260 [Natrarchaeobius halalkaliphilus]
MIERDSDDGEEPPASQPDPLVGSESHIDDLLHWLYLDGDRRLLTGWLLLFVFGACLLLIRVDLITPAEAGDITAIAAALVGGMLPFITVVLAINQLILSEEFGTTGVFIERLEETREYRYGIEDHTGYRPSPVEPSAFLRVLIESKRRTALGLWNVCRDAPVALREAIDDYVSTTTPRDVDAIERLEGASFGTFTVIAVIVHYNDPWQLQSVRRIRSRHRHDLSDAAENQLDRLEELLRDIHVARQYFKTVHMQQELADLSKILLYVGFPTLLGGAFVIVAYGNLLALELNPIVYAIVVSTTITALFSPFAVLLAYVLRIATIARRTAADFGPFVLQQQIPGEEIETADETGYRRSE